MSGKPEQPKETRLIRLSRLPFFFFFACSLLIILFACLVTYMHFSGRSLSSMHGVNAFTVGLAVKYWYVVWILGIGGAVFAIFIKRKFPRSIKSEDDELTFYFSSGPPKTLDLKVLTEISENRSNMVTLSTKTKKREFVIPMRMLSKQDRKWLRAKIRDVIKRLSEEGHPVKTH